MSRHSPSLTLLLAISLLAACGKGYDQEIVVQVFRPRLAVADKVTIEASQAGQAVKALELANAFASCTANQMRIIPRQVDGKYPPVHVVARSGALKAEQDVSIPAANPVKLVLGAGTDLEPAACAPGGTTTDGGPIQKQGFAAPCAVDGECLGGLCLKTVDNAVPPVSFPKGYCTSRCSPLPCVSGGICQAFKNGLGADVGQFCLRECSTANPCPTAELNCTPGGACMPK